MKMTAAQDEIMQRYLRGDALSLRDVERLCVVMRELGLYLEACKMLAQYMPQGRCPVSALI